MKSVARRLAVALNCSFSGISRKLLPVIFPFVTVTVQAQLRVFASGKADTFLSTTGLLEGGRYIRGLRAGWNKENKWG